jgi:hypothetical protein
MRCAFEADSLLGLSARLVGVLFQLLGVAGAQDRRLRHWCRGAVGQLAG